MSGCGSALSHRRRLHWPPSDRSRCRWPEAFQADPLGECRRLCDAEDRCKCFTFANNPAFTRCVGSDVAAAAVSHATGLRQTQAYVKDAKPAGGEAAAVSGSSIGAASLLTRPPAPRLARASRRRAALRPRLEAMWFL